jgi:purine-cytosine permease-like protein
MKSNHFRNGTNLFLVLISTCFCALIIVLLSGFYIYMRVLAIKAEMIDMPLDEENIGRFAGHAVANLILWFRFCIVAQQSLASV